jgi:peroxiredoxin
MKRSALALLIAFTGFSSPGGRSNHAPREVVLQAPLLVPGDDAPLFLLPSTDGDSVQLSAVLSQNTAVALKFWATWCPMCWIEMLEIDESYEVLQGHGVEVLAVAVDRVEDVQVFLERQSIECPVLLDEDSEVAKHFGINALPTTVLLASSGKIIHTHVGLISDLSDHVLDRLSRHGLASHSAQ